MKARLQLYGCALAVTLALWVLFVKLGLLLLPLLGAGVVVLLLLVVLQRWREREVLRAFRATHGTAKDLLVVYTASPHWQSYIEERWLTRWTERVVAFNRSRPWHGAQVEARVWRSFAGLEHTPVAIVIPTHGPAKVVHFFRAFRDFKHGKDARLRAAERTLEAALAKSTERAA